MSHEYELGYRCLGPVFRFFCYRLRLIEQYKKTTPILFLSRGGIRLRHFYLEYLRANGLSPFAPIKDFYISRLAAFRALLAQQSEYAANEIAQEYAYQPNSTAMSYFLPDSIFKDWQFTEERVTSSYLQALLVSDSQQGKLLQQHVRQQNDLIVEYFGTLTNHQQEAILVDTGWSGSIIKSLQDLFPETSITAAFFGRYNYGKPPPNWFSSITGLVLQQQNYSPSIPQSALIFHRHLIESICEPAWPSVKYLVREGQEIVPDCEVIPESVIVPRDNEILARAVNDYIATERVVSVQNVISDYQAAIKKLAACITYPSRAEAIALGVPPRSADFGRDFSVPVLLPRSADRTSLQRLNQSLWRQGQAAIEYGSFRWPVQFALTWKNVMPGTWSRARHICRQWSGSHTLKGEL